MEAYYDLVYVGFVRVSVASSGIGHDYLQSLCEPRCRGESTFARAWSVEHNGAYFYVGIQEYPREASVTLEIFDRILGEVKAENSKRYVYQNEPITLQGRGGREFKFTRPYTTLRVYVDGQRLYTVATDWYIDSDPRKFLDSLRMIEEHATACWTSNLAEVGNTWSNSR